MLIIWKGAWTVMDRFEIRTSSETNSIDPSRFFSCTRRVPSWFDVISIPCEYSKPHSETCRKYTSISLLQECSCAVRIAGTTPHATIAAERSCSV